MEELTVLEMYPELDRVRKQTDLVELVSEYTALSVTGSHMKGCCPFHQEKTPSFLVHPLQRTYFCLGCLETGDAVKFVQKTRQLSFADAVQFLAFRLPS